jgi:hypothetical protein
MLQLNTRSILVLIELLRRRTPLEIEKLRIQVAEEQHLHDSDDQILT